MSPEQIDAAHRAGQFDSYLRGHDVNPEPNEDTVEEPEPLGSADQGARSDHHIRQLGDADLKSMSPEAICSAYNSGQFDDLLGRRPR
jgi:hypothetical protein